jgi:gliding motility-associated-like protein
MQERNVTGKIIGTTATLGATYSWSPATGLNDANTSNPIASPINSATYTVTTIKTATGCSTSDTIEVTVDTAQPTTPSISSIVHPTCSNSKGTITITPTGISGDTYSIDNGVTFQSSNVFSNLNSGPYNLKIKSGTNGCVSNVIAAQVNVQPPTPSAFSIVVNGATTFCEGGFVDLAGPLAPTGDSYSYQWFNGSGPITDATERIFRATLTETYTLVVTNSSSCSRTASAGIQVLVNNNPIATINNGVSLEFLNCTNTLTLTASIGTSYQWALNGVLISAPQGVTRTFTAITPGSYTVTVTENSGCVATSEPTLLVPPPTIQPTTLETCAGNTITLNSNVTSFTDPVYQWKKNGVPLTTNGNNANYNASQDGNYTLQVTERNNSSITSTSCGVSVTINPLPTISVGSDFTITCNTNASGRTVGESPESGFSYSWSPASGLSNTNIANPIANPLSTTTYTLRKTNTTTGCWSEATIVVTVNKMTPNAQAGTDFTKTCVNFTSGNEIGVTAVAGVNYSWSPSLGLSDAALANPIANPTATTTYTVTATNTANGCFSTDTVVTTVDISTPIANAGTDFTKTCATNPSGATIGGAAVTGVAYSWSPSTDLSDATISNPNANPLSTATYTLIATKIATGCTATDSVIVTVSNTPNPIALSTTISNTCPLETVDLSTIQPAAVSGIVYEWWTGTATSRVTQITNPTLYATAGTIYLWSKSVSEGCYGAIPAQVNVVMNVCCESYVGVLQENNPFYLVNYAPADITLLDHINYPTPSVVCYVIVNDLDGKIKQVNTTKPEFTQLPAGNYTVHALVFGPTVVPTGLVIGNKLSQVVPFCGRSASIAVVVQSICSSALSYIDTLTNAKQYALLDLSTNTFVEVNATGIFTMVHTGMPHQVIGFNYTGTASGIQVGSNISGVSATNLDITAGSIISGCTAVTTQIDGNIYNDKDKRCVEGLNDQQGLPAVTLYAKLLNSNNQVVYVSSAIQAPYYTFSMSPDLLDGVYSIILDNNHDTSDAVATYPNSWKGNTQTFTIASGQIVEYLSNTANFVPMCLQSATNKPILKPTANLVGNTYNFCQGTTASSISVDALPGATVNWYTQAVGGVAKITPLIPNTSVIGTTTCYVSQTLNGAESDRTEVIIAVHAIPEQPTSISGNNFIAANTAQLYSVVNSSSTVTYNWILPTDWTGTSTSKDITVQVGTKDGVIGVTATSAFGCISPIQELVVRVVIEDDIEVYNSLSPNGDGDNDVFRIRNIDFYPENTLSIFNRWGIEVYRVNSYGQNDNFFKGFSDGRSTVSRDVELPEGTYFYTLTYKNTKGIERNLSGYLYIKQ